MSIALNLGGGGHQLGLGFVLFDIDQHSDGLLYMDAIISPSPPVYAYVSIHVERDHTDWVCRG